MYRQESVTPNPLVSAYAEEQSRLKMANETAGEFR